MLTTSLTSPAEPKLTPMMEQYRSIKKSLPSQTILFFRLGDFYEMFFEDALKASELLDITLTGREGGEAGRVPMCGIPYHSSQGYIRTLIDHNFKVAICEQVGEVTPGKGLVERKITRIVSPATYLEDETRSKAFEYMCALARGSAGQWAVAYLELSTGEFCVREVPQERLCGELALLAPREVIAAKSLEKDEALTCFLKDGLKATVTVYEDWVFESADCLRLIQEKFKLASRQSLSFHDRSAAVSACGAILYYLRDHLHTALDHLQLPSLMEAHEFMVLDRQTQRSLELVSSLSDKQGPTLLSTLDQTLTSMGTRTLYQWVTHPLLGAEEIRARQAGVGELAHKPEWLNTLRGLFKGVKDVERTLSRLNYGVANARDLVNLQIFLARVPEILQLLAPVQSVILKKSASLIRVFPELKNEIERAIVETPPLSVREGGMIRDGYSKELDEMREIARNGKNWILEFQKREIERTGIKSLRMKYSQVFGYTIEISTANSHLVPPDYIRRQTLANAERFIVPELKTWDEKISGAEDKVKALEYEIFNQIRASILSSLEPLQTMARAIGILDSLAALALTALQRKWVAPEIAVSGELVIEAGRHPVVEMMLPAGQFVENDVHLDTAENQLAVLTGPNMAGKSTYIRQTALIVLLAQIGSYVPARRVRAGLVDRIFTRIGASDDLARGESTFMVEMVETAHILQKATTQSLLILDEVGRGTSTFDGVSIAWAICEFLAGGPVRPRTLFATHYHELTQLEEHFPGIKNYNITVRETRDGIVFLRKVVRGGSDRSYGIHVARLAGIPKAVTERAEKILAILESENTEATQIIEGKSAKGRSKKEAPQPGLFDAAPKQHPLLDELRTLSLDGLTPLQALNKIAEWKEKL